MSAFATCPARSIVLVCAVLALPIGAVAGQAVLLRLEPSSPVVQPGEEFFIDVVFDNLGGAALGGYQVAFGYDTARYELIEPPTLLAASVLTDFFTANAPPFGAGFPACPAWDNGMGSDVVLGLGVAGDLENGVSDPHGHLFRVTFRASERAAPADSFPVIFGTFEGCVFFSTLVDPQGDFSTIPQDAEGTEVTVSDQPPPSGLSCASEIAGVALEWQNGGVYDQVHIYRNGALLAGNLPGNATQFLDSLVTAGSAYEYAIAGQIGSAETPRVSCAVTYEAPLAPVTNLVCEVQQLTVVLTWSNPVAYTAVEIHRNGEFLVELFGDATSFLDDLPPVGPITYAVVGTEGGAASVATECSANLGIPLFLRGDVDDDGTFALADGVLALNFLFLDAIVECEDSVDFDDDGGLTLLDGIGILSFVFVPGSPAPRPPFPDPGADPSDDTLNCAP